jgi:hypothetical protein
MEQLVVYSAWDLAIGTKEHNDYTVGIVVGLDRNEDIWVLDLIRGKWNAMEIVDQIMECYVKHRPVVNMIEKSHVEMSIGPYLEKAKQDWRVPEANFQSLPTGRRDKMARARGTWTGALYGEFMTFPYGKHDDQVDALAWIGLYLTELHTVHGPRRKPAPSWRDKLAQFVTSNANTKIRNAMTA